MRFKKRFTFAKLEENRNALQDTFPAFQAVPASLPTLLSPTPPPHSTNQIIWSPLGVTTKATTKAHEGHTNSACTSVSVQTADPSVAERAERRTAVCSTGNSCRCHHHTASNSHGHKNNNCACRLYGQCGVCGELSQRGCSFHTVVHSCCSAPNCSANAHTHHCTHCSHRSPHFAPPPTPTPTATPTSPTDTTTSAQAPAAASTSSSPLRAALVNSNWNQATAAGATTTTTVEYAFTDGEAKLYKISSTRIVAEQPLSELSECSAASSSTPVYRKSTQSVLPATSNCAATSASSVYTLPLLTPVELQDISKNLSALNANSTSAIGHPPGCCQQRAHFSMEHKTNGVESSCSCKLRTLTRDRFGLPPSEGDGEVPGSISGLDRLGKKKYNKGLAFSAEERHILGIQGLLPAAIKSEEEQIQHCLILIDRLENELDKYMYLSGLAERNERLFYRVLAADISKMMPIVYTPTVGLACQKFSLVYQHPKGLYITIKDKGNVYNVLRNWPEWDVRAVCVTDGERILGLGDLGANGMGIPVGKLSLYTALAGIKPHQCLPVTLDVGTNTQSILNDPLYIGLRQKRVTGSEYDEFLDEFMHAVVRRFGQNTLIQFEDFANANAFRLLSKYREKFCTFNDDIQGTASVAVAGLMASLKIKNTQLKENTILFQGAGEAALGIANLCLMALKQEGLPDADARKRIWMVDSKGLIVKNRPTGGLTEHKLHFAQDHRPIDTLLEAVREIKPTVLIGAAAIGGAFTIEILETMAQINETPIIFALSNPTSKAECTAEQAYVSTKGKCIFASGSPFAPVTYEGKTFYPGQGNNSYIFPGIALGVLCAGMYTIPEAVFLISAKKLAELCTDEDLNKGSLYPPLSEITNCSIEIAASIMDYAFENGLATLQHEPEDKKAFIKAQMYDLSYPHSIPQVYTQNHKL